MYLSRLILNPKSRFVIRDISNCQNLHRTVMSAFPDLKENSLDPRKALGIMHRLDTHPRSGAMTLLIQSAEKPDWYKLPDNYLIKDECVENPACKPIDEQYDSIKQGDILLFRLRANPTKKMGTTKADESTGTKKSNGTRVPLRKEVEQVNWLTSKGISGGFEPVMVKATPYVPDIQALKEGDYIVKSSKVKGIQKSNNVTNSLSFASVLFEGRLKVTDVDLFKNTLRSGIGSGKAYGFGLLSIAPTR